MILGSGTDSLEALSDSKTNETCPRSICGSNKKRSPAMKILNLGLAIAFIVSMSGSVFAVEKAKEEAGDKKPDYVAPAQETNQKPASMEECKKMIKEKEALLAVEKDAAKKMLLEKDIANLKEVLKNMKEFEKSNNP